MKISYKHWPVVFTKSVLQNNMSFMRFIDRKYCAQSETSVDSTNYKAKCGLFNFSTCSQTSLAISNIVALIVLSESGMRFSLLISCLPKIISTISRAAGKTRFSAIVFGFPVLATRTTDKKSEKHHESQYLTTGKGFSVFVQRNPMVYQFLWNVWVRDDV